MWRRAFFTLILFGNAFFVGFDLAIGRNATLSMISAACCGLVLVLGGGDR